MNKKLLRLLFFGGLNGKMKTQYIYVSLLIVLLNGCFSEKHLEFNNVPINGNLDKFANELIKQGFTETQLSKENQIKLNGAFFKKNCEIFVYGTSKSQTVYEVRVTLPVEVHDSLEFSFEKIQKLYTSEYGVGTSKYQQFQNAERFLFNEPKNIRHLNTGDFTRYKTDSGDITLEVRDGYISINYLDKLNNKIRERELE